MNLICLEYSYLRQLCNSLSAKNLQIGDRALFSRWYFSINEMQIFKCDLTSDKAIIIREVSHNYARIFSEEKVKDKVNMKTYQTENKDK